MKSALAEGWPQQATLDKLQDLLSQAEYAQVEHALREGSDSEALQVIAQLVSEKTGGEGVILELISTHTASIIYIIWIRVSPNLIWVIELIYESMLTRLLTAYSYLEQNADEGSVLLFPVVTAAKGVSAYNTLTTEREAFDSFCSRVKAVADAVKGQDKKACVLATEINRFHREAAEIMTCVKRIWDLGAKVKFLKHSSEPEDLELIATEYSIYEDEVERINSIATNINPAKAAQEELYAKFPYLKELQSAIVKRSLEVQPALSAAGSPERAWLSASVSAGNDLISQSVLLGGSYGSTSALSGERRMLDTFAHQLLQNAGDAKRLADQFLSMMDGRMKDGHFSRILTRKNLLVVRASKSEEAGCQREFTSIDGQAVAANQAATNYAFLDKRRLIPGRDSDVWSPSNHTDALLASVAPRNKRTLSDALVVSAEMTARRGLESLVVTFPTRLTQYLGWIAFLNELCDRCGTKFDMSHGVGLDVLDIAQREETRHTDLSAATEKLNKCIVSDGVEQKALRTIGNQKIARSNNN